MEFKEKKCCKLKVTVSDPLIYRNIPLSSAYSWKLSTKKLIFMGSIGKSLQKRGHKA